MKSEKLLIDDAALLLIAQNVDGSFRDGVKMLEQVSFHKGNITADIVRSMGSMSGEKSREIFIQHLSARDTKQSLNDIATLVQEGKDIKHFLLIVFGICSTYWWQVSSINHRMHGVRKI